MYTNQLKDVCNGVHLFLTKLQGEGLQFYQEYAFQICTVVIYKEFFKILRTSVSQKTF